MSGSYQIYVTFSGESGTKIQYVAAVSPASGKVVAQVTGAYQELRGLALDGAGRLYVAVAYKNGSAVDVFSSTIQAGGSRAFVQTLLWPPNQQPVPSPVGYSPAIGLAHPYGLAFAPSPTALAGAPGTLFVSSQDTNVVCGYVVQAGAAMTATPVATASALAPYGSSFYAGTVAASQTGIIVQLPSPQVPIVPPNVPAPLGLSLNFNANGKIIGSGTSKHSVRGVLFAGDTLYVADENGNRVACYAPSSGALQQSITKTHDTKSEPNTISSPVGLAYDPAKNHVYIGSPGKPGAIFSYHVGSGHLHLLVSSSSKSSGKHADALEKISGIAVAPDGTVLFASRKTSKIYTVDGSGKVDDLTKDALPDVPECLLVVPAAAAA